MPLYFDQFEFSNVPADWSMILIGWRGFGSRKLSAEQVIAFSLEQIGKGTEEQDNIAALLANADPGEWQTIDRYLGQIAEIEQFNQELALRKWRLAELELIINQIYPVIEDEDDQYSSFYLLVDFWLAYDELPDSAAMIPEWGTPIEELIQQHQAWVEQETTLVILEERQAAQNLSKRTDEAPT